MAPNLLIAPPWCCSPWLHCQEYRAHSGVSQPTRVLAAWGVIKRGPLLPGGGGDRGAPAPSTVLPLWWPRRSSERDVGLPGDRGCWRPGGWGWLLISTWALGVQQRGSKSSSQGRTVLGGAVSTEGQRDSSSVQGCWRRLKVRGGRSGPGCLSPRGTGAVLAGSGATGAGLAVGVGPLTPPLGVPRPSIWPSRHGKE